MEPHIEQKLFIFLAKSKFIAFLEMDHVHFKCFLSIFSDRGVLDSEAYNVRLIDAGEVLKKSRPDIFGMDEEFKEFPIQAYQLHLTGILPSNCEHDWSPKAIQAFQRRIKNLKNDFPNIEYDARVIFSLRDAFVVDKIRAADTINGISHLLIEQDLIDKKLGISSKEAVTRVKRLAKEAGANFEKKVEDVEKCESSTESVPCDTSDDMIVSVKREESANLPINLNSSAKDDVEKNLMDFSFCSNEEKGSLNEEKEPRDKWTEPPSIERGRIIITTFCDPDNFYINYDTKE